MVAVRPSISRLSCCHLEVIADKTLADWTEDGRVVYPSPPTAPTPKDDEADGPDDDPISHSKESGEPVDGGKSEHDSGSGEDATPKKKEDEESEDESDDQSKTPEDQTAISKDSGLGASGSGDGIDTSAEASNPGINLSTGLPLPTPGKTSR